MSRSHPLALRSRSASAGLLVGAVASATVACGTAPRDGASPPPIGTVEHTADLVVPDASTPSLSAGADGIVHLSVTARLDSTRHALRFLTWKDDAWSASRDIVRDRPFFVNWADFPAIVALENGDLAAHWLEREGADTYAYGVRITRSRDGGATWEPPVTPHGDGLLAEHGFVSLWAAGGDRLGAVWLDGRKTAMADSAREMTVRTATVGRDEVTVHETLLDARTCDCCQTASAATRRGRVIVYRDRSADEIRDIAIVREVDGAWTAPVRVHADEWHFEACPVNGPAVASIGDTVVVAWFTGAQDTARVRVARSTDGGATFGAPIRIDDGEPIGRVSVELDDAAQPIVLWVERTSPDSAEVRVRRVAWSGARSEATTVARVSAARASGFPRMVRTGDRLLFAWTEVGAGVRAATAPLVATRR
jgi:hypothetical protein